MEEPKKKAITGLYRGGYAIAEIAGMLALEVSVVKGVLHKSCALPRFDNEDKAAICKQYCAGATSKQLAEKFGTSPGWITQILKEGKTRLRPSEHYTAVYNPVSRQQKAMNAAANRLSDEDRKRILYMRGLKISPARIAQKFGVSLAVIREITEL